MKMGQPVKGCNPPISPIVVSTELVPSVKPSLSVFPRILLQVDAGNLFFPVQVESQRILSRDQRQNGLDSHDDVYSFPLSLRHLVRRRACLPLHLGDVLDSPASNFSLRDLSPWGTGPTSPLGSWSLHHSYYSLFQTIPLLH